MIELLKFIYGQLTPFGWRVYRSRAIGDEQDPIPNKYMVYKIGSTTGAIDRNDRILTINLWTKGISDTTELDQVVERVDRALRRLRYIDEHHLLVFQRLTILEIDDPNPEIRRRELQYLIKQSERIEEE